MKGPKTLMEFMEMYKTEEDCRKALFRHRWPKGFRCPRCGHDRAYAHKKRPLYECTECGHQASLTAGTIFEGTRTDLKKWFLAIYLLSQTKKPVSSAELSRQLGVAPFTAWAMRRKIMHAVSRRAGELMLAGVVEMDESYVGGASKGIRGRGATGKTPVAVMCEQNESVGCSLAHMRVIDDISGLSLSEVASSFKRWILDAFHGVSAKHLQSNLDEYCYRYNRRAQRTDLFRRVLNRCVCFTEPVTYQQLTVS